MKVRKKQRVDVDIEVLFPKKVELALTMKNTYQANCDAKDTCDGGKAIDDIAMDLVEEYENTLRLSGEKPPPDPKEYLDRHTGAHDSELRAHLWVATLLTLDGIRYRQQIAGLRERKEKERGMKK